MNCKSKPRVGLSETLHFNKGVQVTLLKKHHEANRPWRSPILSINKIIISSMGHYEIYEIFLL
jgi:hypothetical protein